MLHKVLLQHNKKLLIRSVMVFIPIGSLFIRDVAQLVAYHVRDVGVGSSSLLIPTNNLKNYKLKF